MKPLLKIAAIALAILLVILIAIPFLIDVNRFRPQIEAQLSSALGRISASRSFRAASRPTTSSSPTILPSASPRSSRRIR
jgi:uncharacterized membrane protein